MNWADSAQGISWPASHQLCWLPGFDRFVLAYATDSPDAFGYCDFALGHFGPDEDWKESVRKILIADWREQLNAWDQAPLAYIFDAGLVSEVDALAWRNEAWYGHEDFGGNEAECDDDEEPGAPTPAASSITVPAPANR